MAQKAKMKYTYFTNAIILPDGTRKYIRAKTQDDLDEKVLQTQILMQSSVDICSVETFGHFAPMWFDIYKKPPAVRPTQGYAGQNLSFNCPPYRNAPW